MTAKELIEALSKVPPDTEVYVQDNGTGLHLRVEQIELEPEEGDWEDPNHPMASQYPLLVAEG